MISNENLNAIWLFFFAIFVILTGCEKKKQIEKDPAKAILGKWELVEMGNYPVLEEIEDPSGYVEYLPDSIRRVYNYQSKEFTYEKYWIDSLLSEVLFEHNNIRIIMKFEFSFTDNNNSLYLKTYNAIGIFNDFKYNRIN